MFKKDHSKDKNNNRGYEGNKNNKSNNKNHRNGNPKFSDLNKVQEIISYRPKVRETKGSKKTIEETNPDGGKMCRMQRY